MKVGDAMYMRSGNDYGGDIEASATSLRMSPLKGGRREHKEKMSKSRENIVKLRDYFPENWLFELEQTKDIRLER